MKRRAFLGFAAASLAVPAALRAEGPASVALARPRLLRILRDPRAVEHLGRRYRTLVPAEDNSRALTEAIVTAVRQTGAADADDCVQREFAAGHTVTVGGWVLARTEARQCALFSILAA